VPRTRPVLDAPVPPLPLPPGLTVLVPGRGELFVRDSGGTGQPVLLVHGWMFPSDLNWLHAYAPLAAAGFRVLAMDLRGHGRGLRSGEPFTLTACADDAAGVLEALGLPAALVVGYSMGDRRQKVFWRTMGGLRLLLGLFPRGAWQTGMRLAGAPSKESNWVASELSRGSARDLAEAGRELGRFDSSGWVGELPQPGSVIVMTRDRLVPPRKQHELARALSVAPVLLDADHDACSTQPRLFVTTLLCVLRSVATAQRRTA